MRSSNRSPVPCRPCPTLAAVLGAAVLFAPLVTVAGEDGRLLWQIGQPDNDNAEFALAPAGWRNFSDDGLYIVGESDAKRDWPYVHPGPGDPWGGSTRHTFAMDFG